MCRRPRPPAPTRSGRWIISTGPTRSAESLTTLAVAATATQRATIGTCVLQLPLRRRPRWPSRRPPCRSSPGGRFVLGLGVGIHEGEYERAGVDFHRRGPLMDRGIAALRAAWAHHPGGDNPLRPGARLHPRCRCGSAAPATHRRRRAAAVGDGWIPLFLTADEYGPSLRGAPPRDDGGRTRSGDGRTRGRGLRLRGRRRPRTDRGCRLAVPSVPSAAQGIHAASRRRIAACLCRCTASVRRRRSTPHRRDGGGVTGRRAFPVAA